MPIIGSTKREAPDSTEFPGWQTSFDNRPIQPLALSEKEQAFGRDFPGRLGLFTDGRREIILRWVTRVTRKLHPASDCFRGIGYVIQPSQMIIDTDGFAQGCFKAKRMNQTLRVCEQIVDAQGKRWSDVSSWYWNAFLGRSKGPWWAYTVVETIKE